jgi:hypothetical protein
MFRTGVLTILIAFSITFAPPAFAQQSKYGTAAEAKAMLEKAVTAVKTNKAKALDMFNKGEGGFLDRDLYPYCFNISDGRNIATQAKAVLGKDVRTLKDPTGRAFGQEIYDAAQEEKISEVSYMWPRPGPDQTPVTKVGFIMRVGDLGCSVGYYPAGQ